MVSIWRLMNNYWQVCLLIHLPSTADLCVTRMRPFSFSSFSEKTNCHTYCSSLLEQRIESINLIWTNELKKEKTCVWRGVLPCQKSSCQHSCLRSIYFIMLDSRFYTNNQGFYFGSRYACLEQACLSENEALLGKSIGFSGCLHKHAWKIRVIRILSLKQFQLK